MQAVAVVWVGLPVNTAMKDFGVGAVDAFLISLHVPVNASWSGSNISAHPMMKKSQQI